MCVSRPFLCDLKLTHGSITCLALTPSTLPSNLCNTPRLGDACIRCPLTLGVDMLIAWSGEECVANSETRKHFFELFELYTLWCLQVLMIVRPLGLRLLVWICTSVAD